ncbi:MAG: hypothetical protein V2I34_00615 [Bacteroidales bacterium]|jgi:hypothetical protein|nr:hypothetical protein [Bacteroidales bacterium]
MKRIIVKFSLLLLFAALTLNINAGSLNQVQQNLQGSKKETMKNVLRALEEGRDYDASPFWRENEFEFSFSIPDFQDMYFDFEWDFPGIRIDEEFINDMQRKLENIEKNLQEKIEDLERRIDSINRKYS